MHGCGSLARLCPATPRSTAVMAKFVPVLVLQMPDVRAFRFAGGRLCNVRAVQAGMHAAARECSRAGGRPPRSAALCHPPKQARYILPVVEFVDPEDSF